MRALIRKDLRLLAPYWWLIVAGHVLFSANGVISPEFLFWIEVALAAAVPVGLAIIDWRFDADRFVAALPVDRADQVRSRYVGALGAAVLGTVLYVAYGSVIVAAFPARLGWSDGAGPWNSAEGIAVFFLVTAALALFLLPFLYGLGLVRGIWGFGLVALAVMAVTIPLVSGNTGTGTAAPSRALVDALAAFVDEQGAVLAWTLVVVALLSLTWLSARLSIAGLRRREL
jgi:hypothetical protein